MPRGLIALTPFGKADTNISSLAQAVELEHRQRLTRYRRFWSFYHGNHWKWQREENEPVVTVNYVRKFVDVQAEFMFKQGFRTVIPDDPSTSVSEPMEREFVRHMLDETWRRNQIELWGLELGQMGGVTGDAFVRVSWEDNDPLEAPYARADIIPSRYVYPDFGGPFGVDRKKVNSVLIVFPKYRDEDFNQGLQVGQQNKALELYAERWFPDRVEVFDNSQDPVTRPNPLGEIPVVHIPNYPVAGEYFGKSDLADVDALQREFNEKATDISDVINYHGSPVTVVKGAKLSKLEKGANRMWGLPSDADIFNLKLEGDLNASVAYLQQVKQWMHEVGSVPEIALAPKGAKGESAVAIAMQFLPLLNRIQAKQQSYRLGLRLINRLMMKLTAIMDTEFGEEFNRLDKKNRFRNDVVFPHPLPRDESIELDKTEKRLDMRLTSRRREMEQMGLSQGEITQIEAENDQEDEARFEREFKFGQTVIDDDEDEQENRSGNPDPDRPNPEVQGEARSRAAEPDTEL